MTAKLKKVIEGKREWHILTTKTPKDERIITFSYDLSADKFTTHAPPSYVTENGRIVFPGHSMGFKMESLGQFNYCERYNAAYMMTTKGNEERHLNYFLHRVLRAKKKRLHERAAETKASRAEIHRSRNKIMVETRSLFNT